ncbi:MAG: hypothetical protein IPJ20_19665 [Flammeovirgaceae bacterium]|nr:hypothetical protein [Flammeovirgaceae bacterium]
MINTYTFGQTVTHELQGDKTYMVLKHGDSDGLHVLTEEGELAILHLSHVRMKSNTPSIKAADMARSVNFSKEITKQYAGLLWLCSKAIHG